MNASREERLAEIAQHLDISPTDFRLAQERFFAVRDWLAGGDYQSGSEPDTYLQGSFRLGTVVRPFRGDRDGDYDIDQVCQLTVPEPNRSAERLKQDVGSRLRENSDYRRMLDDEGRRCWTLEYASQTNRPGFHIDILPALPSDQGEEFQIDITDKDQFAYSWTVSNPVGYYQWFKAINGYSDELVESQRRRIFDANRGLYTAANDVPLQLVRTSLQRAIQIMKRHRDVHFAQLDSKPISIIITTIATHHYDGSSIEAVIRQFTSYVIDRHTAILRDGAVERDGILDFDGGSWGVPNPVHRGRSQRDMENFADEWNEDAGLALAFFDWVYQLDRDIGRFERSGISDDLNLRIQRFGSGSEYETLQVAATRSSLDGGSGATNNLLDLIHLGIEAKSNWGQIKDFAKSVFDSENGDGKDVAKVNYYQIALHRGLTLSQEAKDDVRDLLAAHPNSAAYRMCCNILLSTVTRDMVRECIREGTYRDVLRWPIMRLVQPELLLPPGAVN